MAVPSMQALQTPGLPFLPPSPKEVGGEEGSMKVTNIADTVRWDLERPECHILCGSVSFFVRSSKPPQGAGSGAMLQSDGRAQCQSQPCMGEGASMLLPGMRPLHDLH